jgi:hypothetical protein
VALSRIKLGLVISTVIVSALGIGAEVLRLTAGWRSPLVTLLSLSEEANVPTWYSSMLLFACAVALASIAGLVRASGAPMFKQWAVLSGVFGYMSLDETAQIHERLNSLHLLSNLRGVFYFGWIIPASIVVLVVGVAYLPFVFRLPKPTRIRFIVAGVIYVGGALVMEMPLGAWATRHGENNLGYALIDGVEETMEMAGAALFLVALLRHRALLIAGEAT